MSGEAKFKAFAAIYCACVAFLYFVGNWRFNQQEQWMTTIVFAFFLYLPFGKMVARMFQNGIDEKANKAYEEQQRQNEENQRNQRLEDKRQELQIEFDHLAKIMMFQSNLDQGKLETLKTMQADLKNAKSADLDTLRRQIEAMKRG
jgi:cell shape-determining protein MreC